MQMKNFKKQLKNLGYYNLGEFECKGRNEEYLLRMVYSGGRVDLTLTKQCTISGMPIEHVSLTEESILFYIIFNELEFGTRMEILKKLIGSFGYIRVNEACSRYSKSKTIKGYLSALWIYLTAIDDDDVYSFNEDKISNRNILRAVCKDIQVLMKA